MIYPTLVTAAALHQVGLVDTSPSAERRSTNNLVYPTLVTASALHQVGRVDTSPSAERRSTNNLVYPFLVTAAALHQVGLVDTSPCIYVLNATSLAKLNAFQQLVTNNVSVTPGS